jgi:hypothetical protein
MARARLTRREAERLYELRLEAVGLLLTPANIRKKKHQATIIEILREFERQNRVPDNSDQKPRRIASEVDAAVAQFEQLGDTSPVTSARAFVALMSKKTFDAVRKAHQRYGERKGTK